MTSGFLDVPGGSLYYEATGHGHPLVLIHAGVANMRMWDPQVPRFSESYQVIAYDTRGFGRTDTDEVEFSNRADIAAVLDHFGAESAYVLGASRGGVIAVDFALEFPDRVDALIVAAGGIGGYQSAADADQEAMWEEVDAMWENHQWEQLSDFETKWWVDGPGQSADRVDPAIRAQVHDWILSNYQAEKNEGIPQPLKPPAAGRLSEIDIPTLVMVGDLDEPATQEACRHLADEVRGARFEAFSGAAPMLNLEQPDRFTDLVMGFLGGQAG